VDSFDGYLVKQRFNVWKPCKIGIRSGQTVNQSLGVKVMGARRIDGAEYEIDFSSGLINPGISIP